MPSKKETPLTVAQLLSDLAKELREKRPIGLVLLDLEDALDNWRDIWPDESKEDSYDDEEEDEDDEDEIL